MEALVVHDGTTAFISTYGVVNTGSNDLLSLTAAVDGSNVVVSASGNEPNLRVTSYRILLANAESGSTGDNVNAVADTTVSSTATAVDTFTNSVYTGAFYVFTGHNATEGSVSASEVMVVSNDDKCTRRLPRGFLRDVAVARRAHSRLRGQYWIITGTMVYPKGAN